MEAIARLCAAYEKMDEQAQQTILTLAEKYAANWPAPKPQPVLRLVVSDTAKR